MEDETIDSDQIVQTGLRELDPNFAIPVGVVDFTHSEIAYDEYEDAELDEDVVDDELETPEILSITQKLGYTPEGNQVVDVVLEVEDVAGAVKYDVRVNKV